MANTKAISRRQLMLGTGAMVATYGTYAGAELECRDLPGPPRRVCIAGLPSMLIHVSATRNPQFQSQWCWAACIAMVFGYYGHPVAQARIVKEAFGAIVNMPGQPWDILGALNRPWVDDNGQPFVVHSGNGSSNPQEAAEDLTGNRPLIIGTQGHAVVLTGIEYAAFYQMTPWGPRLGPVQTTNALVRDPWPGRGRRSLSAQEWYGIMFAARIVVTSFPQ
jgi:hypothetical protein